MQPRALGRKAGDEFAVLLVESIIGWCTARVTKRRGGRTPASIRSSCP
jgi:hypothetical protein